MLIRKNTKAFKTIMEIISACQDRPDREKLVRLYITRAGHSINDRISIEGIQGEAALFYEMNYQAILNYLKSSTHQLHTSEEIPGLYFFRSTTNKVWDEAPFEFDEEIKKEFSALPELPITRKKEKSQSFVLPTTKKGTVSKKEKVKPAKASGDHNAGPKQPNFKLGRSIQFTNLEKVIFRSPQVTKREVLAYYDRVAEYALPYLKDRPQRARLYSDVSGRLVPMTVEGLLPSQSDDLPDWIKPVSDTRNKSGRTMLLCNDKEHLLFYVEKGCLEFQPNHSRTKSADSPDFIIIALESPDSELSKVIQVALAISDILKGLQLPSFPKTDGISGLHIYIPLDSKDKFETGRKAAENICKLVRLKMPDLVTLKGSDGYVYGKVSVDHTLNAEEKSVVAPYSLVSGQSPTVATPLLWEEVTSGLRVEDFNHETIFSRLKDHGDPFAAFMKKKVNAGDLLARLNEYYSFLF